MCAECCIQQRITLYFCEHATGSVHNYQVATHFPNADTSRSVEHVCIAGDFTDPYFGTRRDMKLTSSGEPCKAHYVITRYIFRRRFARNIEEHLRCSSYNHCIPLNYTYLDTSRLNGLLYVPTCHDFTFPFCSWACSTLFDRPALICSTLRAYLQRLIRTNTSTPPLAQNLTPHP